MAIFDDIGKQLSSAAKTIGKKTNDISEIRRLNTKKQSIRRQMESAYTQIGKAYYATASASTHGEADRLCDQIETMLAEIAELDRKIDKVKNQRRCPECSSVQPRESKFCSNCGAKLPDLPQPEPEPEPDTEEADKSDELREEVDVEIDWPMPDESADDDEYDKDGEDEEESDK
ncbi:MAG: zinc ribbon domain-containing protein [Clostridia bacterium]|nr:zinc ribbon domain-containing protein [Clostridia bacterium]